MCILGNKKGFWFLFGKNVTSVLDFKRPISSPPLPPFSLHWPWGPTYPVAYLISIDNSWPWPQNLCHRASLWWCVCVELWLLVPSELSHSHSSPTVNTWLSIETFQVIILTINASCASLCLCLAPCPPWSTEWSFHLEKLEYINLEIQIFSNTTNLGQPIW